MSSDQPPSLRLELAAATAQWAVQHGAALHEHLRLEEREGQGICLVAVDAIDANASIIRIPRTLCVTSNDARTDEDVRRVLGGRRAREALVHYYFCSRSNCSRNPRAPTCNTWSSLRMRPY